MPKIKLVTNVSEYALLRGFARTRGRLVASTVAITAAEIGIALWSAHYVLEVSASVGLNLALITFNMMVVIVAAYLQTVLMGDIFFSGPWREQVILGETPSAGITVKDHNAEFMILLLLLVVGNALGLNIGADGFLDRYHTEGFFRAQLRSETAEDRLGALDHMVDPMNFELWSNDTLQDLVLRHLGDSDPGVQLAAAFNAGKMNIEAARPKLIELAESPDAPDDSRQMACQSLGKLGNDPAARQALETLATGSHPVPVQIGALRGLALMKSPLSVQAVLPLTESEDETLMVHALWVVRNAGAADARLMLLDELQKKPSKQRFCALLDTLKMVATDEDVVWARREFPKQPKDEACLPIIWEERDEKQHYVTYSDSFRVKYLKIVANGGGEKQLPWLERLIADPDQTWRLREVANEIVNNYRQAR